MSGIPPFTFLSLTANIIEKIKVSAFCKGWGQGTNIRTSVYLGTCFKCKKKEGFGKSEEHKALQK